ncbi:MAG: WG repeat-containing protein [Crocinitomicaceae bacterium]|nr:WG repeat-containing protein [Crocinitomicaceae bacterium]
MKTLIAILSLCATYISFGQNSDGLYNEHWTEVNKNGKQGLNTESGKIVLPAVYDKINQFGEYKTDWALVEKDGLFGFINDCGEIVLPTSYTSISKFENGICQATTTTGRIYQIDMWGRIITEL